MCEEIGSDPVVVCVLVATLDDLPVREIVDASSEGSSRAVANVYRVSERRKKLSAGLPTPRTNSLEQRGLARPILAQEERDLRMQSEAVKRANDGESEGIVFEGSDPVTAQHDFEHEGPARVGLSRTPRHGTLTTGPRSRLGPLQVPGRWQ